MPKKQLLTLATIIFGLIFVCTNIAQAATLAERLRGRILLQVQANGEAWYVNPLDNKRIYLRDGEAAYDLMSRLGLGISNDNLNKIPVGIESRFICTDNDNDGLCNKLEEGLGTDINNPDTDGDGYSDGVEVKNNYNPLAGNMAKTNLDYGLAGRLKGRVVLQVQSRGEAWYINPVDGKRYYMPDGPSAYQIMRFLSLGITNQDLAQIPISDFSLEPPVGSDTQAPTIPGNLIATASGTQIALTWTASTDNVGVTLYHIERSTSANAGFTPLATSHTNSYTNTGLSANATYYYRVRASDNAGNISGYSTVKSATTLVSDTQAPTVPGSLVATASGTQIVLTWTASTDNVGVSKYIVERSTSATTNFGLVSNPTTNTYTNTGLTSGTTYYYRIAAQDAAGNISGYSKIASARAGQNVVDTQAPTVPGNLIATAAGTQIALTWTASTDNVGVTLYHIERSTSANAGFTQIATSNTNSYTDTGLSANATYYYRVRASDNAGNISGYSTVKSATTPTATDTEAPTVPSNLSATANDTGIALTWTVSTDNVGVAQYRIERSIDNTNFSQITTTITSTYSDLGLTPNTTYYYRVRASDNAGNISGYSNTAHATFVKIPTISYITGEDYSLPANINTSDFTGYICSNCSNASARLVIANWKTLEPTEGTYDWTYIDNAISNAANNGKTISLMVLSTEAGSRYSYQGIIEPSAVPDWLFAPPYNLVYDDLPDMGMLFTIRVIPSWRPDIRDKFNALITALGARYRSNPTISSVYINAISHARGEELWITNDPNVSLGGIGTLNGLEQYWGLTPQAMSDWLTSRMDAFANAFHGYEHKLTWVGTSTSLDYNKRPDFELVARYLLQYAWQKGIGNRGGGIEYYFTGVSETSWACTPDSNGYLVLNESSPNLDGRYWGDENEEYGSQWIWRFGDSYSDPRRYRMSIMRALQERMRWLWTTVDAETINPPLSNYARLSFGKTVQNSPDAWALLFESPSNTFFSSSGKIKNFEHWLIQRDISGGMTVATQRYDYDSSCTVNNGCFDPGLGYYYDYAARRTDIATNNNYIYFGLDDRFTVSGSAQIKVELVDNSQTDWHLDYYNSAGVLSSAPAIHNTNSGQVKTYTITLYDYLFADRFADGMDFRLVNEGPGDISVRWVRIVRGMQ